MVIYNIFYCSKCKTPLYCPKSQKTKQCPTCNKRITLKKANVLKTVDNLQNAIYIVQNIKLPQEVRQIIKERSEKAPTPKSKREKFLDFIGRLQEKYLSNEIEKDVVVKEAITVGFTEDWISKQLLELEREGRLIHPRKNRIQFII